MEAMDLHQLRVFRAAAMNRGFTRAAEDLHLSQSTVSQHIKQLEEELGSQLFLRVGKRVFLTPSGQTLLEYAERILRELKNAQTAVSELGSIQRGTVRLGTGASTLIHRLPGVIAAHRKRFPDIELIVVTGTTESLLAEMRAQRLDLSIVTLPVSFTDLRVTPLGSEELVVVAPRDHPLGRTGRVRPAELETVPFILYEKQTAMQILVDAYFSRLGITPRITMEMENTEAIKSLIRSGLGFSILPECAVADLKATDALCIVKLKAPPLRRELGLVTVDAAVLPNTIQELADSIVKGLRAG
jgi:DNA-binding transcriptional LysR family regulator